MSDKPYPEGVRKVLTLLVKEDALFREIEDLRPKAERLTTACQEMGNTHAEIRELLRSMDMDAPGNTGYQARTGWFLTEMYRAMKAELK